MLGLRDPFSFRLVRQTIPLLAFTKIGHELRYRPLVVYINILIYTMVVV